MKRIFRIAIATLSVFSFQFSALSQTIDTTKYFIGVNWMNFNGNQTSVGKLYRDTLNSSIYHVGDNLDNAGDSTVKSSSRATWDTIMSKFGGNYIADNYDGAINRYSLAERMLYQGIRVTDAPNPNDSLTNYYFLNHPTGNPFPHTGTPDHWELTDSTANTDVMMMGGNQFPQGWRDAATMSFRLAVKLQVATLTGATSSDVVDVYAIQSHYNGSAYVRDTGKVYGIQWNWLAAANTDSVFFSPSFHFTQTFVRDGTYPDSMLIEVHSKRYVTTRIAFVCIEDSLAHNLLAPVDLNPNLDTTAMHAVNTAIFKDSLVIDSVFTPHLLWIYLADEPVISEYACMARVNHLVNYRGNSEAGGDNAHLSRFIAQVQPKMLFWPGSIGTNYPQITNYLDSGIQNIPRDSLLGTPDSTWKVADKQKYKDNNYGYFPYYASSYAANAHYKTAHDLALDTSYTTDGTTDCNADFDPYELRQGCFLAVSGGFYGDGEWANYFYHQLPASASANTTSYFANVFLNSVLDTAGRYYPSYAPLTASQCAMFFGVSVAEGYKGILYYTSETARATDGTPLSNTGFADTNGEHWSDNETLRGVTFPTQFKSRTAWLAKWSSWLVNYCSELRRAQWFGGYVNGVVQDNANPSHLVRRAEEWGADSTALIDTSYHHSTRYTLKKWPAGVDSTKNDSTWTTYRAVTKPSDTLVAQTAMPDPLTLVEYGWFKKAGPAWDTLWLACVNLYTDERDLMTRWSSQ